MSFPEDLKYTENDEWVRVEGNKGTAGISDYAQEHLSDVVYVEIMPGEGDSFSKGDPVATIESVKAAADVYAPISGKIISVNEGLADNPELINTDPYGEAWMIRFEIADPSEFDGLMDVAAYKKVCEERDRS